jgi:hypothetical protein
MSLVLTAPQNQNFLPSATLKAGLHQVVISNVEDLGLVPLSSDILAKNRAQAIKEGKDPSKCKTEQPKARVFFSNAIGEFIARDYTVSLHDRAGLKKDLDAIGKTMKYGDTLASLVGTQAQLMAINKTSAKGTKYVTIGTLAEANPGQSVPLPAVPPASPKQGQTSPSAPASSYAGVGATHPISDDDIPF